MGVPNPSSLEQHRQLHHNGRLRARPRYAVLAQPVALPAHSLAARRAEDPLLPRSVPPRQDNLPCAQGARSHPPSGQVPRHQDPASQRRRPRHPRRVGWMTQYLVEHCPEGQRLMPKRWKDGMENKMCGETEGWLRYMYFMHYCEGSLMPIMVMTIIINRLKSSQVPFFVRPI